MRKKYLQGMLVPHEQLGLGIIQKEIDEAKLEISFLFFAPNLILNKESIQNFIPTDDVKVDVYKAFGIDIPNFERRTNISYVHKEANL